MKSILEIVSNMSSIGRRIDVSFERKSISVNRKPIMINGKSKIPFGKEKTSTEDCLNKIEELYHLYESSIPSEKSDNRKNYFVAKKLEDLTSKELLFGSRREEAKANLETYFLLSIIDGSLVWDEDNMGKWFWKSKIHGNLIVLRRWLQTSNPVS